MASFKEQINANYPVLVDFYATWCGPCKMQTPVLEELSKELTVGKVLKIDIDKNQAAAQAYKIQAVPTLIIFKHGKEVWRKSGVVPKHELRQIMEKLS
jgi:thioredoxin 1